MTGNSVSTMGANTQAYSDPVFGVWYAIMFSFLKMYNQNNFAYSSFIPAYGNI